MTSEKQVAANRRNAAKSKGPNTAEGKRRSSRNALRHGLSRPRLLEPAIAADIAEFAVELVGEGALPTQMVVARAAAEAQFELQRIRHKRESLFTSLMLNQDERDDDKGSSIPHLISRLDRYERRALRRRDKALDELSRSIRLPIFK